MTNVMEINLAIAGRARAGMALTAGEIEELSAADVLSLGMLADEVRRARVGDYVTFVRVHEWSDSDQEVPAAAKEVRLSDVADTLVATTKAIRGARAAADGRRVTGFSLADVVDRANEGWGTLADVLQYLKAAGLDGIVRAPVDTLADPRSAIRACIEAALTVGCVSVQRPLGSTRTDALIAMRSLTGEFPAIATIAPLSRQQSTASPTTGYDDVRVVALARLVVSTARHVQVDWSQYGPKLAQVALTFGADDLDGVSPIDDERLGRRRMAVEDVKRNISAAGFVPVERDGRA